MRLAFGEEERSVPGLATAFPGVYLERLVCEVDSLLSILLLVTGPPSSNFAASLLHALKASSSPPWLASGAAEEAGGEAFLNSTRALRAALFKEPEEGGQATSQDEDRFCAAALAALTRNLEARNSATLKLLFKAAPVSSPFYARRLLRLVALCLLLLQTRQVLGLLLAVDRLPRLEATELWKTAEALFDCRQRQGLRGENGRRESLSSLLRRRSLRELFACALGSSALTDLATALLAVQGLGMAEKEGARQQPLDVWKEAPW